MRNKLIRPLSSKILAIPILFLFFSFSVFSGADKSKGATEAVSISKKTYPQTSPENQKADYKPRFWLEGFAGKKTSGESGQGDALTREMERVSGAGWNGVMCWGADRDNDRMNYYFRSPFLEKQEWASFKNDPLTPLVSAAHKNGLKVMINIEGVNPYHWVLNKWTPGNIRAVAGDLAADSIDALFEECFEVKPDVFLSLARELKSKGIDYVSGTDPMLLRESNFTTLWPETGIIDIYNYYLKRDKIYNIATLAEHGSLGYGWAKYWGKPTSMISPLNRDWGIPGDYSPAVVSYLCMIRALQFRLDNFIIFGGLTSFDPVATGQWITEYTGKQEKKRPVMDIVVLLGKQKEYSGSETGDPGWNRLFNSGDAITSGAMNAGYDIIVSDKVVPADAYWIYARGGNNDKLPADVVELFSSDKPVFIQSGSIIPSGENIDHGWNTVLGRSGVDASRPFRNGHRKVDQQEESSGSQEEEIPYTGYYKNVYLRFTGADVQRGIDLRTGTIIPEKAINGTVYCAPNRTYGRGPFITGKNRKYVVTASSLCWEAAYPVSDLLSSCGISPTSNVWGIAGKNVTALLAIETTELEIKIPGLEDGSGIHIVVWDKYRNKKSEETVVYRAPYRKILSEYDFILIDRVK